MDPWPYRLPTKEVAQMSRFAVCSILLACCLYAIGSSEIMAQPGCHVPVMTTTASARIHFLEDERSLPGIDWSVLQAGMARWKRCAHAPSFASEGSELLSGYSRVTVSVVPNSEMYNDGVCAEASTASLTINAEPNHPRYCAHRLLSRRRS